MRTTNRLGRINDDVVGRNAHARQQRTPFQMIHSNLQRLFSRTTWRRWLENLRQFEQAMEITELDFVERRVRTLEAQVAELRAQVRKP